MDLQSLMSRYAPPQLGAGVNALAKLAGSLQGCTSSNPMTQPENKYNAGDQVCYTTNGTSMPVTLNEDITDQMTAIVTLPNGKRTSVAVDWLSDVSNCMRGDR